MNFAIILSGGVGRRMKNNGLPKQYLKLFGKPILVYTLERFEQTEDVDEIVVVSNPEYIEYTKSLVSLYQIKKVSKIVSGGEDRQGSVQRGIDAIKQANSEDIVLIHDGVRPMVSSQTIRENIELAKQIGCAVTVRSATETVVLSETDKASIDNFIKRDCTYSMTSPQTFKYKELVDLYKNDIDIVKDGMPLLDAAMLYANRGKTVKLVKEQDVNLKVTTPEDYYLLKGLLELEENKSVFGLEGKRND